MGLLGDMIVRIKGDTGQFVQSLQSTERQTKKFVNFLIGGAGFGAAILVVRKFGQVIGDLVKAAGEEERSLAKLNAAIITTGNKGIISAQGLRRFAEGLMHTRTFTHEATEEAMALLLQIGGLSEKGIKQAIPLIQDYASALNIDLTEAAKQVSSAIAGGRNYFQKYGISLKDLHSPTERLAVLTRGLEEHFLGTSEAIGNTTLGRLERLRHEYGELREELAEKLLPAINYAAKALLDVLGGIAGAKFRKEILSTAGFADAIKNYDNATDALSMLNMEIERTETLLKTRGRYRGPEEKILKELKERREMIMQTMPLLEKAKLAEIAYTQSIRQQTEAVKENVYYMDWIDRLLFNYRNAQAPVILATANARNEFDMFFRTLEDHVPKAQINLSNLFDMEGRVFGVIPKIAKKTKVTFEEMANAIASGMANIISSISQLWNNYYDSLIQDQEMLLENQNLTEEQRKKIEKDIKKMRHEAAEKSKTFTLFEAIITGAQAIINGFATKPFFPLGLAMGALASVLTAVQIAAIAAQPVPAAARGTK